MAIGIPAFLAILTALFGDRAVERILVNPLLEALEVFTNWTVLNEAFGPLLRINARRIIIYHYFSFTGVEAAVPLAFAIVQGSLGLSLLYLFISGLMFGTIAYFVLVERDSFDWWRRRHWRFTMVGLSTIVVFVGRTIVDLIVSQTRAEYLAIIFASALTAIFVIAGIFQQRRFPGLGEIVLQIANEYGKDWFDVDKVMEDSRVKSWRLPAAELRAEVLHVLMKRFDQKQLAFKVDIMSGMKPDEKEKVVLNFRKKPGVKP